MVTAEEKIALICKVIKGQCWDILVVAVSARKKEAGFCLFHLN